MRYGLLGIAAALGGAAILDPSPRRKLFEAGGSIVALYLALRTPLDAAAAFVGEGVAGLGEIADDVAELLDSEPATTDLGREVLADPASGGFLLPNPRNLARVSAAWRYPSNGQRVARGLLSANLLRAELALENQSAQRQNGTVQASATYSDPPLASRTVELPPVEVSLAPGEFRVVEFALPSGRSMPRNVSVRPTWNGHGLGTLGFELA